MNFKSIFIFVQILFVSIVGFSQTNTIQVLDTNLITVQQWRDTCFGLINKSPKLIPSGMLIDYTLDGLNDTLYNSQLSNGVKSDTTNDFSKILYLNALFRESIVNAAATLPISSDSFYINAYRYTRDNNGTIPLAFLFQPYQKINPNALAQGLFTITPDSVRLLDKIQVTLLNFTILL